MTTIAILNGQQVASANAETLEEARANAHSWLKRGVADEVTLLIPGQAPRTIYS